MLEKTRATSGADEKTPSIPQYFSWINNTDEGGSEEQTLINLEYFKWLHDEYGMQLKIYAMDEGNIDGPWGRHRSLDHPKTLRQYPTGFGNVTKKAEEFGCDLGMWAGADGFGDTPEEEQKRREMFIKLCRDHHFHLFKFDTVCDWLRAEKRGAFKSMVDECRQHVPDLITLNHRHDLGEASICSTTYLLGGLETYVDIWSYNTTSGPHHRIGELSRGLVPGMVRLTEDHGVCISSACNFFEDGLILQAFARCLILAPEIYGNPWLLRDDEQARLAKIYNLHAKYRDILVNGFALPEDHYTKNSASRGDETTRLLTFANPTWTANKIILNINGEIGLWGKEGDEFVIKALHPYEKYITTAKWNDKVEIEVEPARAGLFLVQEKSKFEATDFVLTNCEYETLWGAGTIEKKALIYSAGGKIESIGNKSITADITCSGSLARPINLGKLTESDMPENLEQLYEATCYESTNDCFEAQELRRSGETKVPQVKAARDAFFGQENYRVRGCECSFMFDGKDDTFFDGQSTLYNSRIDGGCLRVDFGKVYNVSRVEIEFLCLATPRAPVDYGMVVTPIANIEPMGSVSCDLKEWKPMYRRAINTIAEVNVPICEDVWNEVVDYPGSRIRVTYAVNQEMRYFRLPRPMDRIIHFVAYDMDGNKINLDAPTATNLFSPFENTGFKYARTAKVKLPEEFADGAYVAVATDGVHGYEALYCSMEFDGKVIGSYDRACAHHINNWEHIPFPTDSGYTYYFRLTPEMKGKGITLHALFKNECNVTCDAWLCDNPAKMPLAEIEL